MVFIRLALFKNIIDIVKYADRYRGLLAVLRRGSCLVVNERYERYYSFLEIMVNPIWCGRSRRWSQKFGQYVKL